MDTTLDQLKISASIAQDIEAATGIWVSSAEVWRAIYAPGISFSQSAGKASFSIRPLRLAAQRLRQGSDFRDGSKNRPFKFKDVARRIA